LHGGDTTIKCSATTSCGYSHSFLKDQKKRQRLKLRYKDKTKVKVEENLEFFGLFAFIEFMEFIAFIAFAELES
jgi:hypothetical protein